MAESAFSVAKPAHSLGFLLWQETVLWQRRIKAALEPFGLAHAQFVVLAVLMWSRENGESLSQVEIARRSKLDAMTVSKSLRALASRGLVGRSTHSRDARANAVRLTRGGVKTGSRLIPIIEGVDRSFFGVLDAVDRQELARLFVAVVGSGE